MCILLSNYLMLFMVWTSLPLPPEEQPDIHCSHMRKIAQVFRRYIK